MISRPVAEVVSSGAAVGLGGQRVPASRREGPPSARVQAIREAQEVSPFSFPGRLPPEEPFVGAIYPR